MRLLLFGLCLFIISSCNQEHSKDKKLEVPKKKLVLDSVQFTWYAPGAWDFYAFQVGPRMKAILENDQIKSFEIADEDGAVYTLLRKGKNQKLDFNEWKFQCWNILDETHCFYISGGGIYPKIPKDETSDLRFTLYLIE